MKMTAIQTDLPIPTQPWESAKARFLEGLSPAEVKKFEEATLENLFYNASATQKKHTQGSKSWIWQERLASLVDGIDDYGKALDVFPNMSPMILAPIWGSIRVVLQIVSEAGKFQEKLVDMLAQIGDVLPRFRIFQRLFSNHERLLATLEEVYFDVLQFCVRAKDFFVRTRKSLIPLSVILKGAWKPFRQAFESDIVKFRKHQKLVEKEADLAHMIEAAKARELEHSRRALMAQNLKVKRRHKILAALPIIDYLAKHAKLSALRHPGTNTWFQTNLRFQSWLSSHSSDCLPCYGIPGSGKSVLAASVANDLLASFHGAGSILCYYYCDYADSASLDPTYLIASLIKQVLVHVPLDCFDETFPCPYREERPTPTFEASTNFLNGLMDRFKTVFITIDGVDDLTQDCQRSVLDLIDSFILQSKTIVKVFVTSRTEEHQIRRALNGHEPINLSADHVSLDIELFIRAKIDSTLVKRNPLLENEILKQEVIGALVSGAQGMFLWVKFQLYEIGEAITEAAVRSTIRNLPRSLAETYLRIIEKAQNIGGDERINLIRNVFRWIACVRRPLRIEELEEAVGLEKSDTYLRAERTATNAGERLVSACGNLVVYNSSEDTVTFAHHTIQQFLFSQPDRTLSAIFESVHIDPFHSNKELGEICIAYLSFSDFETQLVHVPKSAKLGRQEIEHMVWAEVPLATPIRGLMSWVLPWKNAAKDEAYQQVSLICSSTTKPSEVLVKKYVLLEYIIAYWPFHAANFNKSTPCWPDFEDVVLHRQLMFDFRPWLEEQHQLKVAEALQRLNTSKFRLWNSQSSILLSKDQQALSIYTWAIGHNATSLLMLSIQLGLKRYFREAYDYANLPRGCEEVFIDIVKRAMTTGPGFWSGHFILFLLNSYLNRAFRHYKYLISIDQLLRVLKAEMQAWASPNCPAFDRLCEEAIVLCAKVDHRDVFEILLKFYVETSEQLARVMISVCKAKDFSTSWLLRLFSHPVNGHNSDETMFKLAFAIQDCLPTISQHMLLQAKIMFSRQSDMTWLVKVVALVSPGYLGLAKALISNHVACHYPINPAVDIACNKAFRIPKLEGTLTTPGSATFYRELAAIDGMDLLAIAFSQARKVSLRSAPSRDESFSSLSGTEWPQVLSNLLACFEEYFMPEIYEARGIHILNWALEWDLLKTCAYLLVVYEQFIISTIHKEMALEILKIAMKNDSSSMDPILLMRWPGTLVEMALCTPEYASHRYRNQKLFRMSMPITN